MAPLTWEKPCPKQRVTRTPLARAAFETGCWGRRGAERERGSQDDKPLFIKRETGGTEVDTSRGPRAGKENALRAALRCRPLPAFGNLRQP